MSTPANMPAGADAREYRAVVQALVQLVNAAEHTLSVLGADRLAHVPNVLDELEGESAFAHGVLGALASRGVLPAELADAARNTCMPANAFSKIQL